MNNVAKLRKPKLFDVVSVSEVVATCECGRPMKSNGANAWECLNPNCHVYQVIKIKSANVS